MFWCLVTIVDFEWNYVQVIDAMHINLTEDRRTHPNFFQKHDHYSRLIWKVKNDFLMKQTMSYETLRPVWIQYGSGI